MTEDYRDSELEFEEIGSEDLRAMAQGCTELTCMYHGRINLELRRRAGDRTRNKARGE